MTSRRELLQALTAGGAGLLAGVAKSALAQHGEHDMAGMDMRDMSVPARPLSSPARHPPQG